MNIQNTAKVRVHCARKALTDRLREWSVNAYRDTLSCEGPFEEIYQTAASSGWAPICRPTAPIELPMGHCEAERSTSYDRECPVLRA